MFADQTDTIQFEILHSISGRVRFRIPLIRNSDSLARGLTALASSQAGVTKVSASVSCASFAIEFDESRFDPASWLGGVCVDSLAAMATEHASKRSVPKAISVLHRATYHFETSVPPKSQFLLGVLSLAASLLDAPVFISRLALSVALMPIINRAVQTLLDERRLGADALDGVSGLLLLVEGSFVPASVMVFLVGLGEVIRDTLTLNCQHMIGHQLALSRRSAWAIRGKRRTRVPVQEIKLGEHLLVNEGEIIAFSGTVIKGGGTVVPANPRADFVPKLVTVGDQVEEDFVLTDGTLHVSFERCLLPKIVDPVLEKEKRRWLQRTRLHRNALRVGYKRVFPVLSAAALLFLVTRNFHRAMALIYFDFITGIKIAVPTAVLASMYRAGKKGVVIRSASALERMAEVDVIIFARSGTLTALKPVVTETFVSEGFEFDAVMRLAASVEQKFNHLGAYAIYRYANLHTIPVPERSSSNLLGGLGVSGFVEGKEVLVGSTRLMQMQQIDIAAAGEFLKRCLARGESRVCVAIDGKLAGAIGYQDPLRAEAKESITALKGMGISQIVMTTAASPGAAKALAEKAGISKVHSRALPEDQVEIVRDYKRRGYVVAVVGHDLDDALAMEQADIAITLNSGVDVNRYRADVVITTDSLSSLVEGVQIARSGMALARQNLKVVSIPNWCGLALTAVAQADPLAATLLNNGSVIIGAANGIRPLLDRGFAEDQS